jgi:hypothetical protein
MAQRAPNASQAQQVLDAAAAEQQYTFLVFYKENDAATQAMAQTVKRGVASRSDRATTAFVHVANPAHKALVDQFGVSRAPMPVTVAVAPNGATTNVIASRISDEQIEDSFVTPAMAHCIKSMQEGKLVFICIHSTARASIPGGVKAFAADPEFKDRSVVVPVSTSDADEAELVQQLEEDSATKGATTVLLAPPGVLVGKFGPTATKQQLATALHKAGQCCDDPNCKHNHGSQPVKKPASTGPRQSRRTSTRR